MVRQAYPVATPVGRRQIAITSQAQAQYLLKVLMATEGLFSRERDPDVDQWVRVARVTLLDVIPADQASALFRETEALLQRINTTR